MKMKTFSTIGNTKFDMKVRLFLVLKTMHISMLKNGQILEVNIGHFHVSKVILYYFITNYTLQ